MRSSLVSVASVVALTAIVLVASLLAGNRPLLGLDLQGGAEVLLRPTDTPANLALAEDPENLDRAASIIRKRVDAIGVAEPDVTVQGTDIVVQLPGLDDQQRVIELVGQTAQLRFRPVLLGPIPAEQLPAANEAYLESLGRIDSTPLLDSLPGDMGTLIRSVVRAVPPVNGGASSDEFFAGAITPSEDDIADQSVMLLDESGQAYLLGATLFTGAALEGADALNVGVGQWLVEITFIDGEEGVGRLNGAAGACFNQTPLCPTGQTAVALDSTVQSINGYETPVFDTRTVSLNRDGGFPEQEAVDSALVLDFGALPLAFDDPAEQGLIRSVSATLGRDSLNAGLVAGAVGLALVALYMLWYYRLLGLAAILSLAVSAAWLWAIVAFLSSASGLALTLAGIVGLIVAVGVSLDSNVVYFEYIKEYVANGSPCQAASKSSFPPAFQTVFWANMATLIGAVILYFLTAGSVKGFALMLGIASVLDLAATWFFMRPLVELLSERFGNKPTRFGIRFGRVAAELDDYLSEGAKA